jgi:hypothetical protein
MKAAATFTVIAIVIAFAGTMAGAVPSISQTCPTGNDMAVIQFGTASIGSTVWYKHTNAGLLNGAHLFWAQPENGQASLHVWQIEPDASCTEKCATAPSLATDTPLVCEILGGVHGPGPWWVGVKGESCSMPAGCIFGPSVTFAAGFVEV